MIFASELPTDFIVPGQAVTIVIVFGVLVFIVNIVAAVWLIIANSRRQPAIESEFATKEELRHLEEKFSHTNEAIFHKLDTLVESVTRLTNSLQRDIGRIEGQLEEVLKK